MANAPIRIGFIGLSASGCWAERAHLPYLKNTDKYRIVALLNSSEGAARAAIEKHGLPAETKAYGSGEAFAQDPEIDLIVNSTRVDKHYPILKPILQHSSLTAKAIHCEWPLGKNLAEAEELAGLAKSRGLRTIIGLQGRQAPVAHIVQNLLSKGELGKPLSVMVAMAGYNLGGEDFEAVKYISDITFGGNLVTIHFSHSFDTITHALQSQIESYDVLLATQRPVTKLRDKPLAYKPEKEGDQERKIVGEIKRTSHDQILLQGKFGNGAVFSFHLRGGAGFPGAPWIDWRIYCEHGEIRITCPSMNLHYGGPGHTVQVHRHSPTGGEVEDIAIPQDWTDEKDLMWTARGPGKVYEAFATEDENGYADWEEAVRRHRLVEEMYERTKEGGKPAKYNL